MKLPAPASRRQAQAGLPRHAVAHRMKVEDFLTGFTPIHFSMMVFIFLDINSVLSNQILELPSIHSNI
jgi:hypothetical protein